jgi:hypothetical protein
VNRYLYGTSGPAARRGGAAAVRRDRRRRRLDAPRRRANTVAVTGLLALTTTVSAFRAPFKWS